MIRLSKSLKTLACGVAVATVAVGVVADEIPDLELLQFLGGWESDDGDTMDPLQWQELLDNEAIADLLDEDQNQPNDSSSVTESNRTEQHEVETTSESNTESKVMAKPKSQAEQTL